MPIYVSDASGQSTADVGISISSDDVHITNGTQDKDILFRGNDGGSTITALTIDMSEGGALVFGDTATIDVIDASGTDTAGKDLTIHTGAGTGQGDGGDLVFKLAEAGPSSNSSVNSHATVLAITSNKYMTFGGASGGAKTNSSFVHKKGEFNQGTDIAFVRFTVPNDNHAGGFRIYGTVWRSACDTSMTFESLGTIAREQGEASKFQVNTPTKTSTSNGSAANRITDIGLDFSSITGLNSASQTFDLRISVTTNGGANNVNVTYLVELINCQSSGISVSLAP